MTLDICTTVEISRPLMDVVAYSADPTNARAWYRNIKFIEWRSLPPLRTGTLVAFFGRFLGRTRTYHYEVTEFVVGERLVMRTAQGPFPMETTYTWEPMPNGATRMTLRKRGTAKGLSRLAVPLLTRSIRRANETGLRHLKQILETAN
ncbi:MAG: SRPBCC family protein [Acidobacteria bacterium]|nr:SRPBCC family protein [Acidobacteriota bacterium]